jgi:phospholipase C
MRAAKRVRLTGGVAAVVALMLLTVAPSAFAGGDSLAVAGPEPAQTPVPDTTTPIKHFVTLMQENHSFDNYFGTRPGADGVPPGTCMPETPGTTEPCVKPFHIGGKGSTDLDHSGDTFQQQYNGGRLDGFVSAQNARGRDGELAMGYYDDRDLPFYWNVADEYVLFDRFFTSSGGGSVRNHMYAITGSPGNVERDALPAEGWGDIPTIFDRLQERGISWKFYIENYDPTVTYRTRLTEDVEADRGAQVVWAPLLAYGRYIDNPDLFSHIVNLDQYYEDAARGDLPAVSFIRPSGDSEHPPGSVQAGQRLVRGLLSQLMRGPQWSSSAFMWAYDDWGGWYDHVAPPAVDEFGYGPRVPALLVSPYAKRGFVDHETHDFTSMLRFIQVNWGVAALASRDANADPMLEAFDFGAQPRPAVLLSLERNTPTSVRPDSSVVYAGYAVVCLVVASLLAFPGVQDAARRRRAPQREGAGST